MIGCAIHRYDTVGSTNDIARTLASEGAAEGTVVVAAEQTSGKGSRGRTWVSPLGSNLLMSVVLQPNLPHERLGELAFVAAVAIAGTIRANLGLDARIKWPNDVRVQGKKIAGIMIETAGDAVVLGIGLNLNWVELPKEIVETATSAAIELGREVDLEDVLKSLLADLDIAYSVFRARGFGRTLEEWRKLEETTGRTVTVALGDGKAISGKAAGVDDTGALIVETDADELRVVSAATVTVTG